jgi:hypothetical protein
MVEAFMRGSFDFQYETKVSSETIHAGFYGGNPEESLTRCGTPLNWACREIVSCLTAPGLAADTSLRKGGWVAISFLIGKFRGQPRLSADVPRNEPSGPRWPLSASARLCTLFFVYKGAHPIHIRLTNYL